ncbi:MAG TPA: hypothetical protein VNO14_19415 [Blastocatellia bacterium]|nr:hypothetical protein [Blastocatellia bacterium]
MSEITANAPPELDNVGKWSLILGVIGLLVGVIWWFFNSEQFFRSYLIGFVFWIGIALGCLAILMVQHMSGGAWGLVIRRVLESATRTFPLLLVLFIPLALGVGVIYEWAHPEAVAANPLLQHKQRYLNVGFFLGRTAFYFLVWLLVSFYLNRWSLEQDRTGDRPLTRKLQVLSGPGLVLYGLTVTFASVDWVMSLEPEWYSTIFGVLIMGGQGVSAMAFVIAVMVLLATRRPFSDILAPRHLHDLGKLLLAFIMLWAYFAFSQFLIIWSGNLPEEVPYYVRRLQAPWNYIGLFIVLFHFALPFVMLLSRDLKRNGRLLAMVAIGVIVMRFVDLYWMIAPGFHEGGAHFSILDLVLPVGIGGIWVWFFIQQLKNRPLIPIRDPHLADALSQHEGH